MAGVFPKAQARTDRAIGWLAAGLAICGGLVLVAITLLTVISITGRALVFAGLRPVTGDFELVEAGVAFAVFAFLPWCQFRRGHVTADLVAERFGPRGQAGFSCLGNLFMTLAAALIAWRLSFGLLDRIAYGETSFLLGFPLWWPYAACLVGSALFVLTSAYTVWRSLNEMLGEGESAAMRPTGSEGGA